MTLPDVIGRMANWPIVGRFASHAGRRGLFMPLNLAICAAVAGNDWDVEIVDECISDEPHRATADVDVVGIGAMTTQAIRAYKIADAYRELGVKVILGGIHPSALPEEALVHADAVCRGDAESTLPAALADLSAGRSPRPLYDRRDFSSAPIATPRKDLLDPADYLVFNPIQTTRGCPHGCSFCTTPAVFGRQVRHRAIADIVAEIAEAKARGSRFFIFADDNVAANQAWARGLFKALIPLEINWASQCDILISQDAELLRLMRTSGCRGLILGLESPHRDILAEARKTYVSAESYLARIRTIQSAGISLWGSFIFGFDGDDLKSLRQVVRFAQRARLAMSCFITLTPYPGTAIFQILRRAGRLLTEDWERYNGVNVVFQPARMSVEQLGRAQQAAFLEFYHPRSALSRLGLWPFKQKSWLANLAIHRGLGYYYTSRRRIPPTFSDL